MSKNGGTSFFFYGEKKFFYSAVISPALIEYLSYMFFVLGAKPILYPGCNVNPRRRYPSSRRLRFCVPEAQPVEKEQFRLTNGFAFRAINQSQCYLPFFFFTVLLNI